MLEKLPRNVIIIPTETYGVDFEQDLLPIIHCENARVVFLHIPTMKSYGLDMWLISGQIIPSTRMEEILLIDYKKMLRELWDEEFKEKYPNLAR